MIEQTSTSYQTPPPNGGPAVNPASPAVNGSQPPMIAPTTGETPPLTNGPTVHRPPTNTEGFANIPTITSGRHPWQVIFAVLAVFITLVGTFILYFLNVSTQSQIKSTNATISRLTQEISNPPLAETDKQLTVINNTLRGYKAALAKEVDVASFIEELATVTPAQTKLRSVSINEKGGVLINARAESFVATGQTLLAFRKSKYLTQVSIINIGLNNTKEGRQGISFDISANLKQTATPPPQPASQPTAARARAADATPAPAEVPNG